MKKFIVLLLLCFVLSVDTEAKNRSFKALKHSKVFKPVKHITHYHTKGHKVYQVDAKAKKYKCK